MTSLSFDVGSIYSAHGPQDLNNNSATNDHDTVSTKWYQFLRDYREDAVYIYRNQLKMNLLVPVYSVTIDMAHVQIAQPELADELVKSANEYMPLVETAAQKLAKDILEEENMPLPTVPDVQVLIKSNANTTAMRSINANNINKLVRVSGIVSSASTPSARATELHLFCRSCRHVKVVKVSKGFTSVQMPRVCENTETIADDKKCPLDPYLVDHDKTKYVDQQILKLQESPDNIPVGELPRHMLLTVDRYLTNKAYPGARVTVHGVYDIFQRQGKSADSSSSIRNPYLRVLGMDIESDAARRGKQSFTPEEEARFIELSRRPDIYEAFSRSVAPSIFGNDDIKKSIACLLLGGSKKQLPDGMKLRGDINVLLLGDPGTAKSQLLKFVEKVAPISVYTSGKGSSAAGLTASVIRDANTREFYLEGGAMVLADGGVVCIDEFDKMREEDRVAIHEAMEQQTISIAKAGITTILNSRTSVLAAANPIFGRYDDMKTPGENIDFQSTILSRFDMIYILKDEHNKTRDEALARFVMNVHTSLASNQVEGELDLNLMRGYISYCRSRCSPRLIPQAREKLASHFVEIRSQVKQLESETNARSSVPITIRQLEAIVRISEAVAKFQLSPHVNEAHVDEAIRLFRVSTYNATRSGHVLGEGMMMNNMKKEVIAAQEELRRRLPVGSRLPERVIVDHLRNKQHSDFVIHKALSFLQARGTIQFVNQGKTVIRTDI